MSFQLPPILSISLYICDHKGRKYPANTVFFTIQQLLLASESLAYVKHFVLEAISVLEVHAYSYFSDHDEEHNDTPLPLPPPKNIKKNHFTDQCIGAFNSGMCHTSCVTTCMHNQLNSGGLLPCNSVILICSFIPCLYAHPCRPITEVGKNRSNNIKVTCPM